MYDVPEKHEGRIYDTVVYSDYMYIYIYMYEMSNRKMVGTVSLLSHQTPDVSSLGAAWEASARHAKEVTLAAVVQWCHHGIWQVMAIPPRLQYPWILFRQQVSRVCMILYGLYVLVNVNPGLQPTLIVKIGVVTNKIVIYFKYFNFHRSKWSVNPHQKLDTKSADPSFMKSYGSRDY